MEEIQPNEAYDEDGRLLQELTSRKVVKSQLSTAKQRAELSAPTCTQHPV